MCSLLIVVMLRFATSGGWSWGEQRLAQRSRDEDRNSIEFGNWCRDAHSDDGVLTPGAPEGFDVQHLAYLHRERVGPTRDAGETLGERAEIDSGHHVVCLAAGERAEEKQQWLGQLAQPELLRVLHWSDFAVCRFGTRVKPEHAVSVDVMCV